jgi:hypothetical protein
VSALRADFEPPACARLRARQAGSTLQENVMESGEKKNARRTLK